MKILQMVDVPWDSGLAHYALVLSRALAQAGHQVFVSALPGEKPWDKARRFGLPTVPLVSLGSLGALRRFLAEERITLINAHTGATHSLAVLSALGRGIAVVRTRGDARRLRARPTSGLLHERTHRIIAAAEYIRSQYLDTFRLAPEKVVTIYQGIDLAAFPWRPPPEAPILGMVARLDPVKGHRYLLEAIAALAAEGVETELRVAGEEANVTRAELIRLAGKLGVGGRVRFLGWQKELDRFMADCALGVISSTASEAVSRVALEWMAAGRPLVATRVGCLPEIVRPEETGVLVEPKSASALAEGLRALLRNPAAMARQGGDARAQAEARFSLSRFVQETERVYAEALAEAGCRS